MTPLARPHTPNASDEPSEAFGAVGVRSSQTALLCMASMQFRQTFLPMNVSTL